MDLHLSIRKATLSTCCGKWLLDDASAPSEDLVARKEEGDCDDGDDRLLVAGGEVGFVQSVVESIAVFTGFSKYLPP